MKMFQERAAERLDDVKPLAHLIRTGLVLFGAKVLRLSRLTDYAVVALTRLGQAEAVETSLVVAAAIGIPEPTVAKVLKALAGRGLVASHRGAHGGYRLARALESISIADVILAIDGPIALTSCVDGGGNCSTQARCPIAGRWDPVNDAIRNALTAISIADMTATVPPAFRIPAGPAPWSLANEVA